MRVLIAGMLWGSLLSIGVLHGCMGMAYGQRWLGQPGHYHPADVGRGLAKMEGRMADRFGRHSTDLYVTSPSYAYYRGREQGARQIHFAVIGRGNRMMQLRGDWNGSGGRYELQVTRVPIISTRSCVSLMITESGHGVRYGLVPSYDIHARVTDRLILQPDDRISRDQWMIIESMSDPFILPLGHPVSEVFSNPLGSGVPILDGIADVLGGR